MEEQQILEDLSKNLSNINRVIATFSEIKERMNKINNNYFELHCPEIYYLLNMFDDTFIKARKEDIITYRHHVMNYKDKVCQHEWVVDYIDIDPDTSDKICYCVKCETTKNNI